MLIVADSMILTLHSSYLLHNMIIEEMMVMPMHLMGSRACFYQQNSQRDEVTSSFLSSTHPLLSIKKYFLSVILLNKYSGRYLYTTASLLIVNSQLQNMFPFLPSNTDQTCIFCNLWPISDFFSILFSEIRFLYIK